MIVLILLIIIAGLNINDIMLFKRKSDLKIGLIISESVNDNYQSEHQKAVEQLVAGYGLKANKVIVKTDVTDKNCYETAEVLVNEGCNLIYSVGDDIEDFIEQSATEHPKVTYCVADGKKAAFVGLDNLHSFSLNKAELRYLTGIVAGYKLNDLIKNGEITEKEAVIGYIALSGDKANVLEYRAFHLGVQSVCEKAKMKVKYAATDDEAIRAVKAMIANDCVMLVQQQNSTVFAETCEKYSTYYIGKNSGDKPSDFCIADYIENWSDSYGQAVEGIINGEELPAEWCKSFIDSVIGEITINNKAFVSEKLVTEGNEKIKKTQESFQAKTSEIFNDKETKIDGITVLS